MRKIYVDIFTLLDLRTKFVRCPKCGGKVKKGKKTYMCRKCYHVFRKK